MRLLTVLTLLFLSLPTAAQEGPVGFAATWGYPASKELGKTLKTVEPAVGPPATIVRFVPGPPTEAAQALAAAMAPREADRRDLLQTMAQLRQVYDQSAEQEGRSNSLANAFAFFITSNLTVTSGQEPSEAANDSLVNQLQGSIAATPALAGLSDADQQAMHDWLVCMAGVVLATYISAEVAQSPEAAESAHALATSAMLEVLDLDPQAITLDEHGISVIPDF